MKPTTTSNRALVLCLVAALTVAPVSFATDAFNLPSSPLSYDFVWSVDGGLAEMAFKKVEGGYLYWSLKGLQTPKFISNQQIASIARDEFISGGIPGVRHRATFTDGLGGTSDYWIVPDLATNGLTGRVESTGLGGVSRSYSIRFADGVAPAPIDRDGRFTVKSDAVIIVIGVAATVGAIACLWNALDTECGEDCSAACGTSGVSSFSEGSCGSCTCTCK